MKTDLYYFNDGLFARFVANTPSGVSVFNKMNGEVVAIIHLPNVLAQIKKAGYTVRKAPGAKITRCDDDKLLADLFN